MKKSVILLSILVSVCFLSVLFYNIASRVQQELWNANSGPIADWANTVDNSVDLINRSTIVGEGKVISSRTELRHDVVFTLSTVVFSRPAAISYEYMKLNQSELYNQDSIKVEVLQTGGKFENIETKPFRESPLLKINKTYMFFIQKTDEGHYLPIGGYQGIAEIKNNKMYFISELKELFADLDSAEINQIAQRIISLNGISEDIIVNTDNKSVSEIIKAYE